MKENNKGERKGKGRRGEVRRENWEKCYIFPRIYNTQADVYENVIHTRG